MSNILKTLIIENLLRTYGDQLGLDEESKSELRNRLSKEIEDFLSKGGEITKFAPNKVRAKPGMGLASKHIGTSGEIGRKVRSKMLVGKGRNIQGKKPEVAVEEKVSEISSFKEKELKWELRNEPKNNYEVIINGKVWKVFADKQKAENIARSLRRKGKDAKVNITGASATAEGKLPPKAGFNKNPHKVGPGTSKDDYEYKKFIPRDAKEKGEEWAIARDVKNVNSRLGTKKPKELKTGFYQNYLGNRPFREGGIAEALDSSADDFMHRLKQGTLKQNPKGSAAEKQILNRYLATPMVQDFNLPAKEWIYQATNWLQAIKKDLQKKYPDADLSDLEELAHRMYEDYLARKGSLEETHSTGTTAGSAGIGGGAGLGIEASPTTKMLQNQIDEGEVVSLQVRKIVKQYPIIFATGSRGMGINDVDLIFKDLRSNRIVAHVVGNNYRPIEINGKKLGGPSYEIRINPQGLKSEGGPISYLASGDPNHPDDKGSHRIFTLTPSSKKIEKTPGPGGTTKLRPDRGDVANYMVTSGTYYGYDLIPESNDDWHTFLEKELNGKIMEQDLAVELGYVYSMYNGDLVFLQQPQTISGEKITIPQEDWEAQGIESPYEPRTPNLQYFNLDDVKETIQSSQGGMGQAYRKVNTEAPLNEYSVVDNVINALPAGLDISQFYAKAYEEYLYNLYSRAEKQNLLSVAKGWYDEYKQKHNMKEYSEKRAPMLGKDIDRIEDLLYTLPKGLDFHKFVDVALKQYIHHKYKTKHWDEWKNKLRYQYYDAYKKAGKDKPQGVMGKVKSWFKEEQAPMFTPEDEAKMVNANDPGSDGWKIYENKVNVWATMSGRGQGGIPADLRVSEIPIDMLGTRYTGGTYRDTLYFNVLSGNAVRELENEYRKKGKKLDVDKIKDQITKLARAAGLEQDVNGKWFYDVYHPVDDSRKNHITYLKYNFGEPYDKQKDKSKVGSKTESSIMKGLQTEDAYTDMLYKEFLDSEYNTNPNSHIDTLKNIGQFLRSKQIGPDKFKPLFRRLVNKYSPSMNEGDTGVTRWSKENPPPPELLLNTLIQILMNPANNKSPQDLISLWNEKYGLKHTLGSLRQYAQNDYKKAELSKALTKAALAYESFKAK